VPFKILRNSSQSEKKFDATEIFSFARHAVSWNTVLQMFSEIILAG